MEHTLDATIWDDEQIILDELPEKIGLQLWSATARKLMGDLTEVTVSIDCDDGETEVSLRVAGFQVVAIDPDAIGQDADDTTVLEKNGRLSTLLDAVLRLPPEAPLGASATTAEKGVDLDYGAGLDVWGPGALAAVRSAAASLQITLREIPPED